MKRFEDITVINLNSSLYDDQLIVVGQHNGKDLLQLVRPIDHEMTLVKWDDKYNAWSVKSYVRDDIWDERLDKIILRSNSVIRKEFYTKDSLKHACPYYTEKLTNIDIDGIDHDSMIISVDASKDGKSWILNIIGW